MQEKELMEKEERSRELYEWVQTLVSAVVIILVVFAFVARLVGVDGNSMEPTLKHKDCLVVLNSMLYNDYKYGDVVVLRKDTLTDDAIVKRVIATENQEIDIDFETGSVYVDGVLLKEEYINELTFTDEGMTFPLVVPEGSVFVMGDNRNHSTDSRDTRLGTVDTRYIIGRAVAVVLPGTGRDPYAEKRDFGRIGVIS